MHHFCSADSLSPGTRRPLHNFASGPAMLPPEVLEEASQAVSDWRGSGLSLLELPFTGAEFGDILAAAEADLRALLGLGADHEVLFLQGGAYAHFALLAMHWLDDGTSADYLDSGFWARRAMAEAERFGRVRRIATAAGMPVALPPVAEWEPDPAAAYCHLTSNETADGLRVTDLPETPAPLIADMSSDFLSRPIPVDRFAMIYASAQKNIGPAGMTVAIIRRDLLDRARGGLPSALDYRRQAACAGKVNTPPTFAIAVAGMMFRWIARQGGLAAMERRGRRRAERIYALLDGCGLFRCPVAAAHRSPVNLCFHLADPALETPFLAMARERGIINLHGHAAVGGFRASLYNAMDEAGVEALADLLGSFARCFG